VDRAGGGERDLHHQGLAVLARIGRADRLDLVGSGAGAEPVVELAGEHVVRGAQPILVDDHDLGYLMAATEPGGFEDSGPLALGLGRQERAAGRRRGAEPAPPDWPDEDGPPTGGGHTGVADLPAPTP